MSEANEILVDEEEAGVMGPLVIASVIAFLVWWFFLREQEDPMAASTSFSSVKRSGGGGGSWGGKKNLVDVVREEEKNLVILYGTQTGTAEDFSNRLAQEGRRWAFNAYVSDIEDVDVDTLGELADEDCCLMFVVATYGEGEPTDNAVDFYEWLSEGAADDALAGVRYTVFGLGDKTYEHYQFMGREVEKHMTRLGGELLFERGEGDEDGHMEEDFMSWQEAMWPALADAMGVDLSKADHTVHRMFRMITHTDEELAKADAIRAQPNTRRKVTMKNPYLAPIIRNDELHTEASERSCRWVVFDISAARVSYQAGDHVGILPRNDTALVDALLARLGATEMADTGISLVAEEGGNAKPPFKGPMSIREVFEFHVDITTPPSKYMLKALAAYATDEAEAADLEALASNTDEESKERYHQWVQDDQRHILQVLEHFESVEVPVDHLIEMAPKLIPRYYSISSSSALHPDEIHVTSVLVNYTSKAGVERKGVCTTYLSELAAKPDPAALIYVRTSHFRLPTDPADAVIMIGPGTGLAPFRGFLQELDHKQQQGTQTGPAILYFGCRRHNEDYIYGEELEDYEQRGVLSKLHVAFSREQTQKVYVQHLVEQHAEELWSLIDQNNAHIYICGDSTNMAADVRKVLEAIVSEHGNMDAATAHDYLEGLHKNHRLQLDVW